MAEVDAGGLAAELSRALRLGRISVKRGTEEREGGRKRRASALAAGQREALERDAHTVELASHLDRMPPELLVKIVSHLDAEGVARLKQNSPFFAALIDANATAIMTGMITTAYPGVDKELARRFVRWAALFLTKTPNMDVAWQQVGSITSPALSWRGVDALLILDVPRALALRAFGDVVGRVLTHAFPQWRPDESSAYGWRLFAWLDVGRKGIPEEVMRDVMAGAEARATADLVHAPQATPLAETGSIPTAVSSSGVLDAYARPEVAFAALGYLGSLSDVLTSIVADATQAHLALNMFFFASVFRAGTPAAVHMTARRAGELYQSQMARFVEYARGRERVGDHVVRWVSELIARGMVFLNHFLEGWSPRMNWSTHGMVVFKKRLVSADNGLGAAVALLKAGFFGPGEARAIATYMRANGKREWADTLDAYRRRGATQASA